jgi:hypothetical protein
MMPSDEIRRIPLTLPVSTVEKLRGLQRPDESFTKMVQRLLLEIAAT